MKYKKSINVLTSDNGKYETPILVTLTIDFDKKIITFSKGNDPQSQVIMLEIPFKFFLFMFQRLD